LLGSGEPPPLDAGQRFNLKALRLADVLTVCNAKHNSYTFITQKSSKILNKFLDVVGYKLKDQIIQKSGLKGTQD
jgi:hypothetical protein